MGYLMIDNRLSGGKLEEYQTFTCAHCQRIGRIHRRQREGGWCWQCAAPICWECLALGECRPFLQKIELALARQRFAEQVGLEP